MQCVWLIEGNRCNRDIAGDDFVCDLCRPSKRKMYNKYKAAEAKIRKAILDGSSRGDINEARKVIHRVQQAKALRLEFAECLSPEFRDAGHRMRISNLAEIIINYKQYLSELIEQGDELYLEDKQEEIEEEVQQPVIVWLRSEVEKEITTYVDPFAEFNADIERYKSVVAEATSFWQTVADKHGYPLDTIVMCAVFLGGIGPRVEEEFSEVPTIKQKGHMIEFSMHTAGIDRIQKSCPEVRDCIAKMMEKSDIHRLSEYLEKCKGSFRIRAVYKKDLDSYYFILLPNCWCLFEIKQGLRTVDDLEIFLELSDLGSNVTKLRKQRK